MDKNGCLSHASLQLSKSLFVRIVPNPFSFLSCQGIQGSGGRSKVIHHSSVKVGKSQEFYKLRLALSRCASGVWPLQNGFCFGGIYGDPLLSLMT